MPSFGRRWLALALVLGAVGSAFPLGGATAGTDGASDAATYQGLASELARTTAQLASVSAQVAQVRAELISIDASLVATQSDLDTTRAQIAVLRQALRARATFIYQHASTANLAISKVAHVEDLRSGQKYANAATTSDTAELDDLGKHADALEARARELEARRRDEQDTQARLEREQASLAAVAHRLAVLLTGAGAVGVMGEAELTATQMAAWFDTRATRYRLANGLTVVELAQMYVDEGRAEHVRPELAFVQAILETGWFKNALDNNYAGIGACDSCSGQPPFPSPRDGVRGQVQMLRNYADPGARATNLAHPPSPTIYGRDPTVAAAAYDGFFAKGRVSTWNLMGNGNWATSTTYASKVLSLYFDLMTFADAHP